MLTGVFSTLLIDETKGKTLEELSNEDQEGFVQGMKHPSPLDAAHSVIYSLP
jgi:PHS family inorganic phosphate transporter-like MFS transporter